MKQKLKKYKLRLKQKIELYSDYYIEGLKVAYYVPSWSHEHKPESFGGGCALLKYSSKPGYCILCMCYHSKESENLPAPGYTVEFSVAINLAKHHTFV